MRGLAVLALVAVIGVAACGGGGGSEESEQPAGASWAGPAAPYPEDGVLPVDGFNDYSEAVDAEWELDQAAVAREYVKREDVKVTVTEAAVIVQDDDLEDDSVRSERFTLELAADGDVWVLLTARRDQRCHEGRGHQDFAPEPCV